MKTNGATWNAYLNSWPFGQWFDDSDETYDGNESGDDAPADAAVVQFSCGVVYESSNDHEGKSLVSHFKAWLKEQTHAQVVVSVPKERLAEFGALLKTVGAKEISK